MKRNIYIDMCKLFAMFMVTWEHMAQYLTGRTFTDFLGGHGYGIAFCMPLFMICSGYLLKPEHIRSRVTNYIWNKFERLMLPCMSWYLIYSMASGSFVVHHIMTFYWFLSCLFVCLSIVAIALKFCKSEIAAILISTIVVVLFPYSDILKINIMLPFIWGGCIEICY